MVECVGRGHRGPLYNAWLVLPDKSRLLPELSRLLCARRRDPEHDAARVLHNDEYDGRVEFWKPDQPSPYMTGDIKRMAGHWVEESAKVGPKLSRWRADPRWDKEDDEPEAA